MKIFVYCRPRDYTTEDILLRFLHIFEQSGMPFVVNEAYAEHVKKLSGITLQSYSSPTLKDIEEGSIMITVGGDGTLLEAVRSLKGLPMPITGVNAGRLGFLASIPPGNFEVALAEIKQNNYSIERRTMLTATCDLCTGPDFPHALNEFSIHRHAADMIEVDTWADGHVLPTVRGDGTIISTPTGSTAYSLSAGGPIVTPECACFVALNIAPHNFSIRPLILPDSSTIELEVHTRGSDVLASLDNRSFIVCDGAHFTIRKSEFYTFMVHTQNISFYDTLRDKILWGVDKRNASSEKFWSRN